MSILHPCTTCGKLTPNPRCPEHERAYRSKRNARQYASRKRRGVPYGGQRIPKALRTAILERDSHRCHYCGAPATQVDHIVPQAQGGKPEPANLVAACARCNREKGARARR